MTARRPDLPACHRAGTDLDPSDLHPGNQYLGQPGPFHRRGTVCRQWRAVQLWLFWLAPIIGGVIGGSLYRRLGQPDR